jgi:methionyl-tRNA formyltransferase
MRVTVITSNPHGGGAGRALERLAVTPGLEIPYVIVSRGVSNASRWSRLRRKALKVWRIGPLGALNGIRLRSFFVGDAPLDIRDVAARHAIRVVTVDAVNSAETARILSSEPVDLGLSLGNGYIAKRIFTLPRDGMINYHGELLPEYSGAQSIIWPVYLGERRTGFTIHRIDAGIDTGDILLRREFDIVFRPTLRETVAATSAVVNPHMPDAIAEVVADWPRLRDGARRQVVTRKFTTPTFAQYLRMERNNRALYREVAARGSRPATAPAGGGRPA